MRFVDARTGLEVVGKDECLRLLRDNDVGRVAVIVGYRPLVFPVNYAMVASSIVFRTDEGTKLFGATEGGYLTAFEIDGTDTSHRTGWSVLVTGRARRVVSPTELSALGKLPLTPWAPGRKATWVRITPETITGRRIPTLGK